MFRSAETRWSAKRDNGNPETLTVVPESPLATLDVLLTRVGTKG